MNTTQRDRTQIELGLLERRFGEVLDAIFADGRSRTLFGADASRALDLYRRFTAGPNRPQMLLEFPLAGTPRCDVIVGAYTAALRPGDRLAGREAPVCQAAVDSVASWDASRRLSLYFELDAEACPGEVSGLSVLHQGQPEVADAFFEAIGEAWRAIPYRAVCARLPQGWRAQHACAFPGRPGTEATRLEAMLNEDTRLRMAEGAEAAGEILAELGFEAHDEPMRRQMAQLAGLATLCSIQMDILPDGSLGPTLSVCVSFEDRPAALDSLFAAEGTAAQVLAAMEQAGTADARWREIRQALFVRGRRMLDGGAFVPVTGFSLPCCAKAKWIGGRPQASKFYICVNSAL